MSDKQYFYDQLDEDIKNILLAQIRNVWTHHSTSLEGNSLTLGETDFILEEGLTIQGKPLQDHNEIFGHAKAIERIYGLLSTSENITKQDLFQLHETVLTERVLDIYQPVGKWKVQSNFTNYTDKDNKQQWREYPAPQKIDGLMQPRLLANLPVLKSGFPPIVVPQEDRYRYKQCLSDYQNTVENLADIGDLAQLPANIEKQRFVELCKGYWSETIELLDQATAMQQKRLKNLQ
ncbi:MAG: Fic family protein [Methylococcaceae bacterium]